MRRFVLFLALAMIAITGTAQQHGLGAPGSLTPPANCAANPFYIDDSTGKLYAAFQGSPCLWTIPPTIVATLAPTTYSSTSAIAPATVYTTPAAGTYRMCALLTVTVALSGGSFTTIAGFTVSGHGFTGRQLGQSAGPAQWADNGGGTGPSTCAAFMADANTAITFGINASSVTGTPTIVYSWTLERLQ